MIEKITRINVPVSGVANLVDYNVKGYKRWRLRGATFIVNNGALVPSGSTLIVATTAIVVIYQISAGLTTNGRIGTITFGIGMSASVIASALTLQDSLTQGLPDVWFTEDALIRLQNDDAANLVTAANFFLEWQE